MGPTEERARELRVLTDAVDWGAVDHAYGFATDVPHILHDLVVGSAAERKHALWQLWGNVTHQGTRYEAAVPTLPLLVAIAHRHLAPCRSEMLDLAVGLLVGFEESYVAGGYDWSQLEPAGGLLDRLQRAFDREAASFVALLADEATSVRAAAARCLGWVRDGDTPTPALRARYAGETDPNVRASILFALAMRGESADAEAALEDANVVVRGMAAVALVRARGKDAPPTAKAATLALSTEEAAWPIPFLHGGIGELASTVAESIEGASEDPEVVGALVGALRKASASRGLAQAQLLVRAAFPKPLAGPLTALQHDAVRALVEADAAWLVLNVADTLEERGLPRRREELAEIAGLAVAIDHAHVELLTAEMLEPRLPKPALDMFEKLAREGSAEPRVWRGVGRLRRALGGDALEALRRAHALDGEDRETLFHLAELDVIDAALGWLDALDVGAGESARVATLRARRLREAGRLDEAWRVLEDARRRAPSSFDIMIAYATIADLRGDGATAREGYQRATELEPADVIAWANLGNLALREGRFDDAVAPCTRAIAVDPDFMPGYGDLAAAYRGLGAHANAVRTLDAAVARKGSGPELRYDRACSLVALGHLGDARRDLWDVFGRDATLRDHALGDPDLAPLHDAILAWTGTPPADAPRALVPSAWSATPRSLPSPSGVVEWTVLEGARLKVAGSFDQIGVPSGTFACIDRAGERLAAPRCRRGATSTVIPDGTGGFFVGGFWAMTDGAAGGGLVRFDGEGRLDARWRERFGGVACKRLARHGGVVFAALKGGAFGDRVTLVAIDRDTLEVVWRPAFDGNVSALAVDDDALVVGGDFSTADGAPRRGVAIFDLATRTLRDVAPPAFARLPAAIALTSDRIYVGTTTNVQRSGIADALVALDRERGEIVWRPEVGPFRGEVKALLVHAGALVVGGRFTLFDGARRNAFAVVGLPDHVLRPTTVTPAVEPAPHPNAVYLWGNEVDALAADGDGFLVAGALGDGRKIVRVDGRGNERDLPVRINGRIAALAAEGEPVAIAGGFSMVGEPAAPSAAAIDLASGDVVPWSLPAPGSFGASDAAGTVIAQRAESFPHATTITYRGDDGTAWTTTTNGAVASFALDAEHVYLAGSFTRVGAVPRHYVACLTRAGAVTDLRLDLDKPALGIARVGDRILVGGSFSRVGQERTGPLVALDAKSGAPIPLSVTLSGSVRVLAVGPEHVFVAGSFETKRGPLAKNALLFERAAFTPKAVPIVLGAKYGNGVLGRAAITEGTIVFSGEFTQVNGVARDGLAAVDFDGNLSDWAPKIVLVGGSPAIRSLAVGGGRLVVGGTFHVADTEPLQANLAVFEARGEKAPGE